MFTRAGSANRERVFDHGIVGDRRLLPRGLVVGMENEENMEIPGADMAPAPSDNPRCFDHTFRPPNGLAPSRTCDATGGDPGFRTRDHLPLCPTQRVARLHTNN